MQERKNKQRAILLFVTCCITGFVYYFNRTDGDGAVDKNMFKNFDLKTINQVVLESKNGRIDLKFTGARWEVNNQFDADENMVKELFATFQQAEPKRPLPLSVQDSVSNELRKNGVKVSLISSDKTESVFYAGGNTQKTQSYFSAENGEPKSYVVTIPGYHIYVTGIFEAPENDWKNKYVFGFNWRNFQRLETRFPQKASDNFDVALQDNYFTVQGLSTVDTTKLNNFLDDVSLLTVDEYADADIFPDSLSKPLPVMVLTVKDIGQRAYTLALYPPQKNSGQMVPGLINDDQWAFLDPRKVRSVFKPKSFFEK